MKRVIIFFYIFFGFFKVHGQIGQMIDVISSIDEVQLTAGPSIVSLYNENTTSDQRQLKIAYTLRGALIYDLSSKLSLGFNFLFERKGLKTKLEASYYDESIDSTNCLCTTSLGFIENNTHFDYLTLSITPRYSITDRFYFGIGPYASYLTKVHGYTKNSWDGAKNQRTGNNSSKEYDIGIHFLIGYYIKISDWIRLTSEISDTYGLLDITKITLTKTTTNSLSMQLGFNLKL